jgi:hypothetical protein
MMLLCIDLIAFENFTRLTLMPIAALLSSSPCRSGAAKK